MKNIAEIIANLPPEKRAQLMAKLGNKDEKSKAGGKNIDSIAADQNFAFQFRSNRPFDFEIAPAEVNPPDPGFVQIEARAASLNFRDVMISLGLYPASPEVPSNMGSDYAGYVVKVGEGVKDLKEGDEVIVLSAGHLEGGKARDNFHFAKRINVYQDCVVPKPRSLSFAEASCIPTVFLTSYVGLVHMAKLSKDDSVLIHTATGGVGLSSIQIAKWAGAQIFATAGSPEKREYLKGLGINDPMDSRSLEFESRVMGATGNKGIDVVMNTLSSGAVEAGMRLLKPFGRFIHVDKKDIAANRNMAMGIFQQGISFVYLDISLLFRQPALLKKALLEIVEHFDNNDFKAINYKLYPAQDLKKALHDFSRSAHIGKLVLNYM